MKKRAKCSVETRCGVLRDCGVNGASGGNSLGAKQVNLTPSDDGKVNITTSNITNRKWYSE